MWLCQFFCCGGKANLVSIFLLNPRIFFLYIGIGIRRGWTTDRKLHVDTLIFISMWKFNMFHILDIYLVNTLLLYSLSPYSRIESLTEKWIHLLRVGWRNLFSSCAVVSVFCSGRKKVLVHHTPYVLRVPYSFGVLLVFLIWREVVFGTYVLSVQYCCLVVSVFLLWWES